MAQLNLKLEMRATLSELAQGEISTGAALDDLLDLLCEPWARAVLDQLAADKSPMDHGPAIR